VGIINEYLRLAGVPVQRRGNATDVVSIAERKQGQQGYGGVLCVVRACGLPVADGAGVDVDEIGARVVADAAAAQRDGDPPNSMQRAARHVEVDRLSGDVIAMLGNSVFGQELDGIGRRRR
jgi:hypothetical protein